MASGKKHEEFTMQTSFCFDDILGCSWNVKNTVEATVIIVETKSKRN